MAYKLLPCPFCGGKPEFRRSSRNGRYIACTGCDSASTMFTAAKDDVRDLLVETWNKRYSGEPIAYLVWMQGRRAADDVEDYYVVAKPGDKGIDGSEPFPVFTAVEAGE